MAFDIKQFRKRTSSAIVFALAMLFGLLYSTSSFTILFFVIMFGCYSEFRRLLIIIHREKYVSRLPLALLYIILPVGMMLDLGMHGDINSKVEPLFPCVIVFGIWINDTMAYIVGSLIGRTPFSSISPGGPRPYPGDFFCFVHFAPTRMSRIAGTTFSKITFAQACLSIVPDGFGEIIAAGWE